MIDNLVRGDFLQTKPDEEPRSSLSADHGNRAQFCAGPFWCIPGMALTLTLLFGIAFFDRHFMFANGIVIAVIFPLMLVFRFTSAYLL